MSLFALLHQDLQAYLDEDQIEIIHQAYLLAEKAHTGQKRCSGEDYISHPVAVAQILAGMHLDAQSIMAALLHDVIEDTPVEKHTIARLFGEPVAELVDGVSKLTQISFESKAEAQAENFQKMVLAMTKDIRVIIVKLADRLHNMRTIGCLRPEKRHRIAKETLDIYAPIANRLGMHKFYIEFEDLGFEALYPLRHRILKRSIRKARVHRREIIEEIESSIKSALEKHHLLKVISVKGRKKHLYSIYKKMLNRKIPFNEIMDFYAFRIIVEDIDSCYRVLGVMHQLYKPLPERFKDYIAIPKANSYQSLHTTLFGPYGLPIEIQIRTTEMNRTAEKGIAAHWLYKSSGDVSKDKVQVKVRAFLKGLMELQATSTNPLEFIENVKIDLFPDEVYVFTPKGEIMELPGGATAVDFAYAVHTDIGSSCIAAKINRRLAPLSTQLMNGQTVEIITAPGARPNPAWLSFVVTSKARSDIRHVMRDQKRTESINLGRQLLEKSLEALGIAFQTVDSGQYLTTCKQLHYKTLDDMYEAIGLGNQLPITVARFMSGQGDEPIIPTKEQKPLQIKGSQGMLVTFAECCRPIPDDPIVGVFRKGKGLVIHYEQCPKVAKIRLQLDKCVNVQWEQDVTGDFKVDLIAEVENQRGVLAQLASAIAAAESNIEDISVDVHDGRFNYIYLTIDVRDRVHLARVMRRIRAIKTVTKLNRKK